jgi:hypothetical protein
MVVLTLAVVAAAAVAVVVVMVVIIEAAITNCGARTQRFITAFTTA